MRASFMKRQWYIAEKVISIALIVWGCYLSYLLVIVEIMHNESS